MHEVSEEEDSYAPSSGIDVQTQMLQNGLHVSAFVNMTYHTLVSEDKSVGHDFLLLSWLLF